MVYLGHIFFFIWNTPPLPEGVCGEEEFGIRPFVSYHWRVIPECCKLGRFLFGQDHGRERETRVILGVRVKFYLPLFTNKRFFSPLTITFSLDWQKKKVFNVFAFVHESFKEKHQKPSKLFELQQSQVT